MKAGEFIGAVEAIGTARGPPVRFDKSRGKGSHGTLYFGSRFTVVKDRRKECGPGLIGKMLSDLGLTRDDLRSWR
jgi:mRNA interferase HicA